MIKAIYFPVFLLTVIASFLLALEQERYGGMFAGIALGYFTGCVVGAFLESQNTNKQLQKEREKRC